MQENAQKWHIESSDLEAVVQMMASGFYALTNPVHIRILQMLGESDVPVPMDAFTAVMDEKPTLVSRRLEYLKMQGLVEETLSDAMRYFSLTAKGIAFNRLGHSAAEIHPQHSES